MQILLFFAFFAVDFRHTLGYALGYEEYSGVNYSKGKCNDNVYGWYALRGNLRSDGEIPQERG